MSLKIFIHHSKCFCICPRSASAQAARKHYQPASELAVAPFKYYFEAASGNAFNTSVIFFKYTKYLRFSKISLSI